MGHEVVIKSEKNYISNWKRWRVTKTIHDIPLFKAVMNPKLNHFLMVAIAVLIAITAFLIIIVVQVKTKYCIFCLTHV